MIFEFDPKGVCSRHYTIDIDDNNIIKSINIVGGCNGNLSGISKLLVGMTIDEVINNFSGIKCGIKPTSCPDQIAKALIQYKKEYNI